MSQRHGAGRARDVAAICSPTAPWPRCPSRTSPTACTCRPGWAGPCASCSIAIWAQGWRRRADDPATWQAIDDIPDEELWAAREAARAELVAAVRTRSELDRLRRGEPLDYVEAAASSLDPERADHRLRAPPGHLQAAAPADLSTVRRALGLLGGPRPVQFLFAGKAHPQRRRGQADRCSTSSSSSTRPRSPGAWPSSRTTTWRSRSSWCRAATSGSTCRGLPTRPAAPAG